jgi:hypothetical protein
MNEAICAGIAGIMWSTLFANGAVFIAGM